MNSVIEAQITLKEETEKELERCKDIDYFMQNHYSTLPEEQKEEIMELIGIVKANEETLSIIRSKQPKFNKRFLKK